MLGAPFVLKSDGELYSVINQAVRLTGMPAWDTADDDDRESGAGCFHPESSPRSRHRNSTRCDDPDPRERSEREAGRFLKDEGTEKFLQGIRN